MAKTNRRSKTLDNMVTVEQNIMDQVQMIIHERQKIEKYLSEIKSRAYKKNVEVSVMGKIDWKAKFGSRKFWALIVALIVGILAMFALPENTINQIAGIITSFGAIIVYILTEGKIDAASATANGMVQAAQATQQVTNNYTAPLIPQGYVQVGDTIMPEHIQQQDPDIDAMPNGVIWQADGTYEEVVDTNE